MFLATRLIVLSERPGRDRRPFRSPLSARIAAGDDPRAIRSEPAFTAAKAKLRGLMDGQAGARLRNSEMVS